MQIYAFPDLSTKVSGSDSLICLKMCRLTFIIKDLRKIIYKFRILLKILSLISSVVANANSTTLKL